MELCSHCIFDKGKLKIYSNGILTDTLIGQVEDHDITTSNGKSALGCSVGSKYGGNQNTDCFKGSLDEVRIYNRALSDNEIRELYNATK